MAKGGKRQGAGRKPGVKNKATIERELIAARQIDAACRGEKKLAVAELEKAIAIAEGVTGLHRPQLGKDARGNMIVEGGDWKLFGEWFDRWVFCLKELAKYQSPQIKAIDAPTPLPDPSDMERKTIRRFGLRIFEGGKPILSADDSGAV